MDIRHHHIPNQPNSVTDLNPAVKFKMAILTLQLGVKLTRRYRKLGQFNHNKVNTRFENSGVTVRPKIDTVTTTQFKLG
jgi:hypothetical protein